MKLFGKVGMRYSRRDVLDKAIRYVKARQSQVEQSNDASIAAEVLRHNLQRIVYDLEGMRHTG